MLFPNQRNWILLILVSFISIVIISITNKLIISDELYYNNFAEQFTIGEIENKLKFMHKIEWLGYAFIPIIFFLKFSLIALVLLTGFFFFDKKVSFSVLFKAVMLAELPFLVVPVIKLFWFLFVQTSYTLSDLQYFFPLSALQLFDVKALATWQIYPLQLLNVFEAIYWVLLAFWLKKLLNISLTKGMEVVVYSYGSGLLLWVVFITFLSINAG